MSDLAVISSVMPAPRMRLLWRGPEGALMAAVAGLSVPAALHDARTGVIAAIIGPPGTGGGGGGGISNGDKGDIVVSGGGATFTIDPSVLTVFGRTIIGAPTAAGVRSALQLGSAAMAAASDFAAAGDLAAREPAIAAGTNGQYWRGDKSWQTLDKAAVGLTNIDNTSDANKPVSTAQAAAIAAKADDAATAAALALKAPLASPALTGAPSAPTPAGNSNSTQIATTAFVQALIAGLIASAPGALDTLDELAAALGDDANFAATMTAALAGKQPLDATLTALAALAGGADKLPYFTGTDILAQADLTAFGRSLIALADYAALRAGLNVANGATANSSDAALLARANHTGTQAAATISDFAAAADTRADARIAAAANLRTAAIGFVIDGGGSAITTGIKGELMIPFACTITAWTLICDQAGSIEIDIWKDTYANYPPVIGDVITASAKPAVSAANKGQSSTLTGWTTAIAAGDTLRFNVNSAATVTRATLILTVTKA